MVQACAGLCLWVHCKCFLVMCWLLQSQDNLWRACWLLISHLPFPAAVYTALQPCSPMALPVCSWLPTLCSQSAMLPSQCYRDWDGGVALVSPCTEAIACCVWHTANNNLTSSTLHCRGLWCTFLPSQVQCIMEPPVHTLSQPYSYCSSSSGREPNCTIAQRQVISIDSMRINQRLIDPIPFI